MANVSADEGYWITSREALLLKKPLLLSANFAHLDLINYDGAFPVLKQYKQKPDCPIFKEDTGNYSFANVDEISCAMKYVVDNYTKIVKSIHNQNFNKLSGKKFLQVIQE